MYFDFAELRAHLYLHPLLFSHLALECRVEIVGDNRGLKGLGTQLDLTFFGFPHGIQNYVHQHETCVIPRKTRVGGKLCTAP
jgi:hypothetical protein